MNKSPPAPDQGNSNQFQSSKAPRAIIHRKILDAANERPKASVEELAATVSGATIDLVERVLDEYGDPAEGALDSKSSEKSENGQSETGSDDAIRSMSEHDTNQKHNPQPNQVQLTEKQQETIRAISKYPEATQRELAEFLDVSCATINKRVNSIEGFEWDNRQEFIKKMDENEGLKSGMSEQNSPSVDELSDQVNTHTEQITDMGHRLMEQSPPSKTAFTDLELAHKMIRACMNSENITEDEELRIIHVVLTSMDKFEEFV